MIKNSKTSLQPPRKMPWHLFLIFLALSVSISLSGYFYYQYQKEHIIKAKSDELAAVADLKVKQIKDWREERLKDASFIFNNPQIAAQAEKFQQKPSSFKADILGWMTAMHKNRQYKKIFLLDKNKKLLISVPENSPDIHHEAHGHSGQADPANQKGEIFFSDIYKSGNSIFMDFIIPLLAVHPGDKIVGYVVLLIDPNDYFYPLIQSWPIPSSTAETLIVRREDNDVVYLNELRHMKDTAFKLRFPVTKKDLPAVMAGLGVEGVVEGIDYRRKPVLAALKAVPYSPWFLVAKVDLDEVYQPYFAPFMLITLLVLTLILATGLGIGIIWRKQQLQFYEKQSEASEALRASELRFRELFENMSSGVAVYKATDNGDNFIFSGFNSSAEKITKARREDIIGKCVTEIFPDVKKIGLLEVFHKVWKTGIPEYHPVSLYKDDKLTFWTENYIYKLPSDEIIAIFNDITARKKTEEELKESEERFRSIIDNTDVGYFFIDKNGIIRNINNAWLKLYKYDSSEEVIGQHFTVIQKIDDIEKAKEVVDGIMHGDLRYMTGEFSRKCRDNSVGYHTFSSKPVIRLGEVTGIEGFIIDTTERKKAEEELKESEHKFHSLFDTMEELAVIHELVYDAFGNPTDYRILDCNPAFSGITGISRDKAVGALASELYGTSKAPYLDIYAEVTLTREQVHFETFFSQMQKHFSISVFSPGPGKFATIASDITERKKTEEELTKHREHLEEMVEERTLELEALNKELIRVNKQLKELDHLKSMFIASMSHELRTPLNSILGFTGIILQGWAGEINEEQRSQLSMVKNSAAHLLELINDIIDLSKIEAGKVELHFEDFDLNPVIHEIYESFRSAAAQKNLELALEIPGALPVNSDKRRVKQVIINLISNALKFTDKGKIKIVASPKLQDASDFIEISVEDTGTGIRKEDIGALFKAFGRIHYEGTPMQEGTGLGLYLSKKIADMLGGYITTESEFGKGSRFVFGIAIKKKQGSNSTEQGSG